MTSTLSNKEIDIISENHKEREENESGRCSGCSGPTSVWTARETLSEEETLDLRAAGGRSAITVTLKRLP